MDDERSHGSFLGTGWGFPPAFSAGGADVEVVSGFEDVHQSLQILLGTRLGERVMNEDYGCDLDRLMFEEIDQRFVNRLTGLVTDAIIYHEPRVKLLGVDVSRHRDDYAAVSITITYEVRGTNSRFNMVYPFYVNEANTGR